MKRNFIIFFSSLVVIITFLTFIFFYKQEKKTDENTVFSSEDKKEISITLAQKLWNDLNQYSPNYDLKIVLKTIKQLNSSSIKKVDDKENYFRLAKLLAKEEESEIKEILNKTEKFLSTIALKSNIIEVQKNKVYYEIISTSQGSSIGNKSCPLIHFIQLDINDNILYNSRKKQPIRLEIAKTFPGFQLGIKDMKEGERRKMYIHPSLAFEDFGKNPNELLIYDIEILSN